MSTCMCVFCNVHLHVYTFLQFQTCNELEKYNFSGVCHIHEIAWSEYFNKPMKNCFMYATEVVNSGQ